MKRDSINLQGKPGDSSYWGKSNIYGDSMPRLWSGNVTGIGKRGRKLLFVLVPKILKPTSDYKAIVQHIVSLLIHHLWLKTLLTGHWGGPYGGVKAQGSWLSVGCRGTQTKPQPAGPQPHRVSMEQRQISHWGLLLVRFQSKVWSMEIGHFNIIRSAIHTPASSVTWPLLNGE